MKKNDAAKKDDSAELEITEPTIVTMDTEQIIEVTLAKFKDVETSDYASLVAPYRNLDFMALDDEAKLKEVEEVRKTLKATRIGIERLRKALKEDSLKMGRAIDAKAKELTEPIVEPENFLEDLVAKHKRHVDEQEKRKAEALTKMITGRMNHLAQYGHVVTYEELLGMEELDYQELLQTKKSEWEVNQAMEAAAAEKAAKDEADRLQRLAEMDAKERELFKKELALLVKGFASLLSANSTPLLVPDNIPIDICNEMLEGVDWCYESNYVAPVEIEPLNFIPHVESNPIGILNFEGVKRTDLLDDFFEALDATKDYDANRVDLPEYDSAGGYEVANKPESNAVQLTDEEAAILLDRSDFQNFTKLLEKNYQYWPVTKSEKGMEIARRFNEVFNEMKSF